MPAPSLDDVIEIIREIRDDLAEDTIDATSMPDADLGLDSLDLIQLARALRKRHGVQLDLEGWRWKAEPLGSILDHLEPL